MIDQNVDETLVSLLEVSGEPLLYHQIVQLRKLGISRYIVAVEKVDGEVLNLAANLRRDEIEIEFVSRLTALSDMLGPDDSFLMISGGIWANDKHIEDMIHADTSEILVFDNEKKLSEFELIDSNYRWSGLARLSGDILSLIDDLPEDSAVQSTLLRLALQHDCALKVLDYAPSSLTKIADQLTANGLSENQINSAKDYVDARGFSEIILFYPLTKFALRSLWKKKEIWPVTNFITEYSYLIFFALAIVFALLNFIILSYTWAVIGCFFIFLKQFLHHLKPNDDNLLTSIITNVSIIILLIVGAFHWQNLWSIGLAVITFLLGYSVRKLYFQPLYDRLILSFADIFLIMIIASILSIEIYAIMSIAILYSSWIFCGILLYKAHQKR